MNTYLPKIAPPSEDRRWKLVAATMRRHGYRRDALIEALHTVQQSFGYLDRESLRYVALCLRLPLSRAFGVATFYHFFSLKPLGEHTCVVCMGTACYIKGAPQLVMEMKDSLGVKPGETTPDGRVSFLTARCIGSCSLAPAAVFDGVVAANVTASELRDRLHRWEDHDARATAPDRGR
jgi:bidirectional [NiFe] hydrogenase diaphorase subunit